MSESKKIIRFVLTLVLPALFLVWVWTYPEAKVGFAIIAYIAIVTSAFSITMCSHFMNKLAEAEHKIEKLEEIKATLEK